jgi:hypothetical protein
VRQCVVAAATQVVKKDTLFTGIRLIRSAVAGHLAQPTLGGMGEAHGKGKSREDHAQTSQAQTILVDIFESLNDANFDEEQLDLLRRLFLAAASETEGRANAGSQSTAASLPCRTA